MAGPTKTIWAAQPHTLAKHLILKHYLAAWFPILASSHQRIVYYDGFAGPGRYSTGELGSPLVAIEVAKGHSAPIASELVFVFVERKKARADHLSAEVERLQLPSNFKCTVLHDEFDSALRKTLDGLQRKGLQMAPTFALIDPFGIAGLPLELIARLLRQRSCEVLITFMKSRVDRWATVLPDQIDALVGQVGAANLIANSPDRIRTARELYEASLRTAAKFVRFFEMCDVDNRPIYDLFFASSNALGHYRMKQAMWRANETGEFTFSDGVDPAQAVLFTPDAPRDFAPGLWEQFRGKSVSWEEIKRYTQDATPFLDTHARGALKLLEAEGGLGGRLIRVATKKADGTVRKKNTYPAGTLMTFVDAR